MATIFNDSIMRGYIDRLFIGWHIRCRKRLRSQQTTRRTNTIPPLHDPRHPPPHTKNLPNPKNKTKHQINKATSSRMPHPYSPQYKRPYKPVLFLDYNDFRINEFALSTTELSRLARYICVVASLSCPIPSLITDIGMPLALATDAQL